MWLSLYLSVVELVWYVDYFYFKKLDLYTFTNWGKIVEYFFFLFFDQWLIRILNSIKRNKKNEKLQTQNKKRAKYNLIQVY